LTAIILSLIILLTSCNDNKYVNLTFDINTLGNDLLENASFDDELVQVNDGIISTLYHFGECESIVAYAGSGATAEEIIIIEGKNSENAKNLYEKLKSYLQKKKITFEDYNPSEMYKLKDPVLAQYGNYVVYCISKDNEKAQSIINKYIG